jgi:solute:Na+ symporter, SSS family
MTEEFSLAQIDRIIIYAYFVAIIFLGIYNYRTKDGQDDYLIAGRSLSLGAFIATLVSTFYGGILGVGEFTYRSGLVSWFTQGFFYYIFAVIYAFFLAPKIRKNSQYTLPDQLYKHYNRKSGLLGSFFTFLLVSPAPYVLMVGTMLHIIFGWSLLQSILIGTLFSTIYVFFGGLRSVVRTDMLQFVLMFVGFGLILPFAWFKLGNITDILPNLPEGHTNLVGKLSVQQVFAWGIIAMWTIVSPSFYQRCSAAKSEQVAKKGILISIGFWFLFDMMTLSAGLYARFALSNIDPVMAYPLLGQAILPPIVMGIFFVGMLATIMSSLDSNAFLSAITLGRDFIWRLKNQPGNDEKLTLYTRIGLIISAILAIIIATSFQSVIDIWYALGSLAIPILFLPLLTSFFPKWKLSPNGTFLQMAATGCVSLVWFAIGFVRTHEGVPFYPFEVEPMYPGLISSILIWSFFKINNKKNNE